MLYFKGPHGAFSYEELNSAHISILSDNTDLLLPARILHHRTAYSRRSCFSREQDGKTVFSKVEDMWLDRLNVELGVSDQT